MPELQYGIDISWHIYGTRNPSSSQYIDMRRVKAEGFSFGIFKATDGDNFTDPTFVKHWNDAKAAGLIPGAYLFIDNTSIPAMVDRFVNLIDSVGGPQNAIIAVDAEGYNATKARCQAVVDGLRQKWPLIIPWFYTNYYWWVKQLGNPGAVANTRLWMGGHAGVYIGGNDYVYNLAQKVPENWWTTDSSNETHGWPNVSILQITSSGLVAGKKVDGDIFKGSVTDLKALTYKGFIPTVITDLPTYKPLQAKGAIVTLDYGVKGDWEAGFHTGRDWGGVPLGTPIHATKSGTVIDIDTVDNSDYGRWVKVKVAGQNIVCMYTHCSKILVKEGQFVKQGQQIATVGETGRVSGPHLHYEERISPYRYGNVRRPIFDTAPAPVAPSVSLSAVKTAARFDPNRPQGGTTSGAKDDVLIVERALNKEGLLESRWIDGSFGTKTKEAYSKWQYRLGYRGTDADGIPGKTSLTKLGNKYGFKVVA